MNFSLEKWLQTVENKKKRKYLEAFLWQLRHFYPFFVYVDELIGMEAEAALKFIASHPTKKWKNPILRRAAT